MSVHYHPAWPQDENDTELVIIQSEATFECSWPMYVADDVNLTCTGPNGHWEPMPDIYPHCIGRYLVLVDRNIISLF